jgi:transposase InsO family protein
MEAADSSVSMDLLVRSLAAMGETALRDAIAGIQRQGVRVGLYIEGYLLDVDGMVYEDAWNGRPATVTRQGDQAVVNLELGLQQVGCLVVRRL